MKNRVIISALLLLLFSITNFSCNDIKGEDTTDITTDNPTDDTTDINDSDSSNFYLINNGEAKFPIVRKSELDAKAMNTYNDFKRILNKITGSLEERTDSEADSGRENPEILFGKTNYPQTAKALSEIGYSEYVITLIDKKLVIAAHDDTLLPLAVKEFSKLAESSVNGRTLALPRNLRITGTDTKEMYRIFAGVPGYDGGMLNSIKECGDEYYQATVYKTGKKEFDNYCRKLEANGFSLYADNEMSGNYFMTYTKGGLMVHTYLVSYSGEVRIIAAENARLPSTEKPSYKKIVNSSFTMFGLEKGGETGGLGCMFQLEDGSFIIIDGGHNTVAEAEDIYMTMYNMAKDKNNIVIRSWIFTHAHGDHYGAFRRFAKMFGSQKNISIESFIYNYCDTDEQTQFMSDRDSFKSSVEYITQYYPKADIYKPLTGQVFHFAGADIEILSCMSDFLPRIIGLERSDADKSNPDTNIQCIVFRVFTAGQSVMITGDVSKVNVDEMCKRYGNYLKSDLMTVPHHGWNENRYRARNGTVEFYTFVDPLIVFWPDGVDAQAKKMKWNGLPGANWEANYYLIYSLHVKEYFVAGKTTRTFILPYTGAN